MHVEISRADQHHFLSLTRPGPGGCLLWTGPVSASYGLYWHEQQQIYAHRFALAMAQIPAAPKFLQVRRFPCTLPPGKVVRHRCVHHLCVAIPHLFLSDRPTPRRPAGLSDRDLDDIRWHMENALEIGVSRNQACREIAGRYNMSEKRVWGLTRQTRITPAPRSQLALALPSALDEVAAAATPIDPAPVRAARPLLAARTAR